jgi:uncharacterized membrane protein
MLSFLRLVKPQSFFVIAALTSAIVFTLVTPPFQSPDEMNHFCRAYQLSEGKFLPEKKDQRLGGMIPTSVGEFFLPFFPTTFIQQSKITKQDITASFAIPLNPDKTEFRDFPNTAYYSVVSYLPQAFALMVLRKMDCSVGTLYYGARLFTLLIWLLAMWVVIQIVPLGKWLFTLLLLLPMQIYITCSFSADTVTNICSFLLLTVILRYIFSDTAVTPGGIGTLFVLAGLLALAKVVYLTLLVPAIFIPFQRFGSRKQKAIMLSSVFVVVVLIARTWSAVILQNFVSYENYDPAFRDHTTLSAGTDYFLQKQFLLQNPAKFLSVIYQSLFDDPRFYLVSYVGHFGTYMDTALPVWLCVLVYFVLMLVAAGEQNSVTFTLRLRLVFLLCVLLSYLALLLSLYLTWAKVQAPVAVVHGRYLAPILPLLFIAIAGLTRRFRFNPFLSALALVVLTNGYSAHALYKRYFKETYKAMTEFTTGFEWINTNVKRTGQGALRVNPMDTVPLFKFPSFNAGDIVRVTAWVNQPSGSLLLYGSGTGCKRFGHENSSLYHTDKNGWIKMDMTILMDAACRDALVIFAVKNRGHKAIYIDDIHFTLRQQ